MPIFWAKMGFRIAQEIAQISQELPKPTKMGM